MSPAADEVVTIRDVRRITGRTDITVARMVKDGRLPKPDYLEGLRVWKRAEVLAALERLRAKPPRSIPSAGEGRDFGHMLRVEFAELKAAAADALERAGVDATGKALARFTHSGKLADVAPRDRRAATRELRRLAP